MLGWFGIKKTLKMGIKSLWMHRLRSTLTTLGIVFGVCSVIAMLAIGEGASKQAQETIKQLGSTNLIIETIKPPDVETNKSGTEGATSYGLTYADAESIRNTISDIQVVVPIRKIDHEAQYLNRRVSVKIIGTIPWYTEIFPTRIIRGRFLSSIDLHHMLNVCVIDENITKDLFAFDDPIGKDIKIQGSYYRVVGIVGLPKTSTTGNNSFAAAPMASSEKGSIGSVYIPLTTAKIRFGELTFELSGGNQSAEKVELHQITVKVKSTEQVLPMRDILSRLLDRLHDKEDYRIVVPLELLRQAAQTRRIFSIVLGSIAAISLIVGGIGIMNIMLASVSERTREIGIRRALGAKKRDIIIQFLTETILLTLIGGVLGIILGATVPFLVTYFGHMPTIITGWSLIAAFGISGGVGVTSGLYPAYLAANMDPIESLRHE